MVVLRKCRDDFEQAHYFKGLGMAMTAIADVEDQRGHGDIAIRQVLNGLRFGYLSGDVLSIAVGYHHLGGYLHRYSADPDRALACHLAATLILMLIDAAGSGEAVSAAGGVFRDCGMIAPPRDVPDLCRKVGDIPGTNLPDLIASGSPDPAAAEKALRFIIAHAQEIATAPSPASTHAPTMARPVPTPPRVLP